MIRWLKKLLPWFFILVTLTWDPSPTSSVIGYRVYEVTKNGQMIQMIKDVGNVLQTEVYIGQCFVVTAYDAVGNESGFSNIACGEPPKKIQGFGTF